MKEYWGINPEIVQATDDSYRALIRGNTAGLVIGDRAFDQRRKSTFIYDLGSEWRSITGLPFVFAAWVSIEELPDAFIRDFDKANAVGLTHIDEIADSIESPLYDMKKYYTLHLSYTLDQKKREAINKFLSIIT
jgi:chorismate dehydratase